MKETFKNIISLILKIESQLVLWKYKPKVITITGSVGKTSTKDAVYAIISQFAYVRKSEKSYNSEIGLPLTILGCPNGWDDPYIWLKNILKGFLLFILPHKYPQWLVLEVGVGKPGDMKKTASWVKSDAVIFTTIGDTPVHIEFFNSREHLIKEKSGLIKTLKKDGLLVLNFDDEAVASMKGKTKNRVMTYGFKEGADVLGSEENIFYTEDGKLQGIVFRVDEDGKSLPVIIEGVFGRNHVYASLASLALAFGLKFNMLNAVEALKRYEVPPGRMCLLDGIKDSLIIDDTYNSSPFACESALKTLSDIKLKGRKIAVLGDMLELGKHTEDAHKNIGKIAEENVKILVVVGNRAKKIKEGAIEAGMKEKDIFEFLDSKETGEFLETFIKKNDLILVKGSQGMRMERIVATILKDKENKDKLLVRQDKEWLNKE
ncbi:MAG: Mur ligase family protein [Candidatus Paceibacterota bacterium]|jgi:UDP-N-acetylmuramoyl-tripeptide--D-alanyl-D-alanine ligase